MQEPYKEAIILIRPLRSTRGLRWRSSCAVKFLKDGREAVEYLKIDVDYDTAKQAERVGLRFAKKWVDLNFETGRGKRSRLQPTARDSHTLLGMSRHFVKAPDMLALDLAKITRLRSELMEARVRSHKLLENSRRTVREYREAVEYSQRLLDQSRELRLRAAQVYHATLPPAPRILTSFTSGFFSSGMFNLSHSRPNCS